MKAAFIYAVRYRVSARCITPLHTSGPDGDLESVLRGYDGHPMIQGSSLAGAFRSWLIGQGKVEVAERIFGRQRVSGHLMVSDGRFNDIELGSRPRVWINGATGSARDRGKFDLTHVDSGAQFEFELVWLSVDWCDEEISAVEAMLAALHNGAIRLGGQKSNGFGRVELSVHKQVYDMRRAEDRTSWLEDRDLGQPIELCTKTRGGRVEFILKGMADSILIQGAANEFKGSKRISSNVCEAGYPVIPGSSVKGAVRHRAELIAEIAGCPAKVVEQLFGRGAKTGGDTGIAGKILVEDVRLDGAKEKTINRIKINRFTGGVIRGGLFSEKPLCAPVTLRFSVPMDQPLGCALLLYALRDLGLGLYNLGGGGAIGRGYLTVEEILVSDTVGNTACLCFDQKGGCAVKDDTGLIDGWMQAWKEARA